MSRNGLLAREHLDVIFLNLEELISINEHLLTQLNNAVSAAVDAGDEVRTVSPHTQRPFQLASMCLLRRQLRNCYFTSIYMLWAGGSG